MNLAIQISQLYDAAKNAPVTLNQIERLEQDLAGIRTREIDFMASNRRIDSDIRECIDKAEGMKLICASHTADRGRRLNPKDTPVWFYDHMHRISRLRLQCHPSQHSMLQCHQWAVAYLDTIGAWDEASMLHTMHDIQTRTYLDAARHLVAVSAIISLRHSQRPTLTRLTLRSIPCWTKGRKTIPCE